MYISKKDFAMKLVVLFLSLLFCLHTAYGTDGDSSDLKCKKLNESCGTCVEDSDCFYCGSSDSCHSFKIIPKGCSKAQWYVRQCTVAGFWIIIVLPCVAVLLIICLICCCWCCCCRKDPAKQEEKYRLRDTKRKAQKDQRQAYFEERNKEREVDRDRMRSKYGLYNSNTDLSVSPSKGYQRISDNH